MHNLFPKFLNQSLKSLKLPCTKATVYNPITSHRVQHDHTLTTNGKRAETAIAHAVAQWLLGHPITMITQKNSQQQQKQSSLSSKLLVSSINPQQMSQLWLYIHNNKAFSWHFILSKFILSITSLIDMSFITIFTTVIFGIPLPFCIPSTWIN